ncbi:MAG: helix-turn-helix transcriptional regulator [Clostridiales bacterium]|jgi:transcriptional regulator with XRE-family HTH domain|nr:helix-turn-helix transcriptional regulator [Clostridiales bacterium]
MENNSLIKAINKDFMSYRSLSPIVNPFRALGLSRSIVGASAEKISTALNISRSYYTALENYHRPITLDLIEKLEFLFNPANKAISPEIKKVLEVYISVFCESELHHSEPNMISKEAALYLNLVEQINLPNYQEKLECLCLQGVCSLPYFEIIWDECMLSEFNILCFSQYPDPPWEAPFTPVSKCRVPKTVLIPPEHSLISWLSGAITPERLLTYYEKQQGSSVVLADRTFGFQNHSFTALTALAAFIYNSIDISLMPGVPLFSDDGQITRFILTGHLWQTDERKTIYTDPNGTWLKMKKNERQA